jgi:AraC-like DNA-binding protein
MTKNLSTLTNSPWHSVESRFKRTALERPLFPRPTTMPALEHVKPHTHAWGQLAYISKGVLTMQTSQGAFVLPPQQALWLPPGIEHESFCRYGGAFRSVYIDLPWCERLGEQVYALDVDELLRAMILEVCRWPTDYELNEARRRFIDVFIDRVVDAPKSRFFLPTSSDPRLTLIVSELHANPACQQTLEQWGERVGASSRTLNRLFHKHFDLSFRAWKQKLRALQAIELLTAGHSQQHVAAALGFESSAAFNHAFKKALACSPGQYLKRL